MLRLAFDIAGSDHSGEAVTCVIAVRRFDAPQLVRHIGRPVLLFRPTGPARNSFVASAILSGLAPGAPDARRLVAELGEIERFARPVEHAGLPRMEGVPWINLPAAMFDAILENGLERPAGLAEAPAHFDFDLPLVVPPLETLGLLGEAVRRNYAHSCALTGLSQTALKGELEVVPIRPIADGGPVHVNNCLPLVPAAAKAFAGGHVTVRDDLRLIADLSRIDLDLLAALNPAGRLNVPADETLRPASTHLAWHRGRFLAEFG